MATILDKIITQKKKELSELKDLADTLSRRELPRRSFIKTLETATDIAIISEFKRASPSLGVINSTIQPEEQAKLYETAGADAISVLTDTSFFKGSFEDLRAVKERVELPVLCKDFIIDPIQLDVASRSGADLVLLIAAVLDDDQLQSLYTYAKDLGLEVLMEVHSNAEAKRVLRTGNRLIGVNNRDLRTFTVDLATTEAVGNLIKAEGGFLISESGIKSSDDVRRVIDAGANGILVGETFMKHQNVIEAIQSMKLPLSDVVQQ